VAEGTPEQIAATPESYTGEFLKPILEGREVEVGLVQEAFAARVAAPVTKAAAKRAVQAEKAAANKRLPGEVPTNGRAPAKKAVAKKAVAKKAVAAARKAS
jgi:excinuclease ABC subunit A